MAGLAGVGVRMATPHAGCPGKASFASAVSAPAAGRMRGGSGSKSGAARCCCCSSAFGWTALPPPLRAFVRPLGRRLRLMGV